MAHSAAAASQPQPVCTWSDESGKFEIYLRPSAIDGLASEAWVAYKRVPRRGLEIGGVLLGHAACAYGTTTFWIDGFTRVESEYRTGPSYMPSESDLERLQDEIRKNGSSSVGLFRSHTRAEQLAIQKPDAALLDHCFASTPALFLMVGPVQGKAALFLRANGNLHCIHELPLPSLSSILLARPEPDSQETGPSLPSGPGTRSPVTRLVRRFDSPARIDVQALRAIDAPVDPQAAAAAPVTPREEPPAAAGRKDEQVLETAGSLEPARATAARRVAWIFAALLPALLVAAILSVRFFSTARSSAPAPSRLEYIRLGVERTGSALTVHWDRNSPALRGVTHAVLHIKDGETQLDRTLSASELNAGSVAYEPKNADVGFALDVYSADPRATGAVQVMNLPAQVEIPRTQPAGIQRAQRPLAPSPPARSAPPVQLQPVAEQPDAKTASVPIAPARQEIAVARAKPSEEIDPGIRAPDLPIPEVAANSSVPRLALERLVSANIPRDSGPFVSISAEPVTSSKLGRVVKKVPLLRRLASHENIEQPVPEYQAQPALTLPNHQPLDQLVLVDVKVDVAETGRVSFAEITDYGEPPNFSLANAALAAAKQWTFKPARSEDLPVSSQVVLHFRFNP